MALGCSKASARGHKEESVSRTQSRPIVRESEEIMAGCAETVYIEPVVAHRSRPVSGMLR